MSTYIYGMVNITIYIIMCSMFGEVLLGEKLHRQKNQYILYMVGWILIEYLFSVAFDRYVLIKIGMGLLLNTIALTVIYQRHVLQTAGVAVLYQAIGIMIEYLVYRAVGNLIPSINIKESTSSFTGYLIGTLSQVLLILFVIWFHNRYGQDREDGLTEQEWIEFMVFPVFSLLTILAMIVNFEDGLTQGQKNTVFFVVFGMALMNIFVFYLIISIVRRRLERKQEEILLEHAQQTKRMYLQEKKRYDELQHQRHEYKNRLLVIRSLLEKGDYERVIRYTDDYCIKSGNEEWFDTNHSVVNAIINSKYREAVERHILLTVRFNDLSGIFMKDEDMISVLSNLLDNAIEAASKSKKDRPQIRVKFEMDDGNMILVVENDWNQILYEREGKILSSKQDRKIHGYGLDNVKRIVRKYGGIYMLDKEGERFRVVINIPAR